MLRALVWKEWRQQRSIVAVGAGLAFILPVIVYLVGQTASNRMLYNDRVAAGELRRRWRFVGWLDEDTLLVSRRFVLYRERGYTAWSNQAGCLDIVTGGIEIFAGVRVEGR